MQIVPKLSSKHLVSRGDGCACAGMAMAVRLSVHIVIERYVLETPLDTSFLQAAYSSADNHSLSDAAKQHRRTIDELRGVLVNFNFKVENGMLAKCDTPSYVLNNDSDVWHMARPFDIHLDG
eukprot:3487125-Amphidinium_carterae.1